MRTCYTPGPWRAEGGSIKAISHGRWFTVARAERKKFTPEGIAGNAQLLAAAPDLLAALEDLFEHCAMVHKHWGEGDNSKAADAAQKAALAAIVKARGE